MKELPRSKNDVQSCAQSGYHPRNFYTILPAVEEIRQFASAEVSARQRLMKDAFGNMPKPSAFQPVVPKGMVNLALSIWF